MKKVWLISDGIFTNFAGRGGEFQTCPWLKSSCWHIGIRSIVLVYVGRCLHIHSDSGLFSGRWHDAAPGSQGPFSGVGALYQSTILLEGEDACLVCPGHPRHQEEGTSAGAGAEAQSFWPLCSGCEEAIRERSAFGAIPQGSEKAFRQVRHPALWREAQIQCAATSEVTQARSARGTGHAALPRVGASRSPPSHYSKRAEDYFGMV